MNRRSVHRLVALYPRAWRARYGSEVADLAGELVARGETTWLRAGLDLAAGAAAEHCHALRRSVVPVLAAAAAAGVGAAGIGLAVARVRHGAVVMSPYFDTHPAALYRALFFAPLFLIEITTLWLLTLSPMVRLSRATFCSFALMLAVFSGWALTGFGYPSAPAPIAFNVVSKLLAFVTVLTLFLPQRAQTQARNTEAGHAGPQASS